MYSFWCMSPVELVIWVGSVLVAVFATIEDGISTSVAASLALLLVRLARPRGHFLGRVTLHNTNESSSRDVYIPLSPNKFLMNKHVVYPPSPGMVVYRFEESFLYPNSSLVNDAIVDFAKAHTHRGRDTTGVKYGVRPWNDPGKNSEVEDNAEKPLLRAVVMAFLDSLRVYSAHAPSPGTLAPLPVLALLPCPTPVRAHTSNHDARTRTHLRISPTPVPALSPHFARARAPPT
ncbi:uncharacterized protein TRAVEDRAFT_50294 [Trametes versicolor FP-101664 SS1]|uniref:uncharacterized protein n=1 Tax=Trametes versicolor (strain FP-101664) TaxID=717944 RepID=UPI00046242EF|nr:uncharacterized protein TRAVEDRAFT_50294 [Trametes versicolor FP-101664 SS1]EIW55811.1 hypothetical protein TRAVEDRAFT_50294 [Trametes versicolor FP-101664 SS1]